MNETNIRVWITKYAMSSGILEMAVRDCGNGMVADVRPGYMSHYHGEGREWHRTHESAVARAEEMRTKKLRSLQAQIEKIAALKFDGCRS